MKFLLVGLCLIGLIFGFLRIVTLFLFSFNLLAFLSDLAVFVSSIVRSSS